MFHGRDPLSSFLPSLQYIGFTDGVCGDDILDLLGPNESLTLSAELPLRKTRSSRVSRFPASAQNATFPVPTSSTIRSVQSTTGSSCLLNFS
jgi:hypothetical protein